MVTGSEHVLNGGNSHVDLDAAERETGGGGTVSNGSLLPQLGYSAYPAGDESPIQLARTVFPGTGEVISHSAGWHEVREDRTIEELQRELDDERGRERVDAQTQTADNSDQVPEDCNERWFAGFSVPVVMTGAGNVTKEDIDYTTSSPVHEVEGTHRPERQMRRRSLDACSRSPSQADDEASSSSSESSQASSSSSSSDGTKRQRVTSSEEEDGVPGIQGTGASTFSGTDTMRASGAESAFVPVDPRMRAVADYSDVV